MEHKQNNNRVWQMEERTPCHKSRRSPSVKNLYELGQQSTTEIMNSFQIGSRRTFYKVLQYAGVITKPVDRSARKEQKTLSVILCPFAKRTPNGSCIETVG
jgi:hypothetical protein